MPESKPDMLQPEQNEIDIRREAFEAECERILEWLKN